MLNNNQCKNEKIKKKKIIPEDIPIIFVID